MHFTDRCTIDFSCLILFIVPYENGWCHKPSNQMKEKIQSVLSSSWMCYNGNLSSYQTRRSLKRRICRWTALLCTTYVPRWPPPPWPLKWGVCGSRWSWCALPQARSWVCAHPVLTDGKGGNAVDLRWPRARSVHSQRQTISIISASPGAIMEAALQHCFVHVECMRLTDPVHLGRRGHVPVCVLSSAIWWILGYLDSWQQLFWICLP